jgi:glycosyltransferase involved in cell wall biosynthesis
MTILVPEFGFSAGTETVLLRVLPRWAAAGHRVILAAPSFRLDAYARRGLDVAVERVEIHWPVGGWRRIARFFERRSQRGPLEPWFLEQRLRDLIRTGGVTHVFVPWIFDCPATALPVPVATMVMDLAWQHYDDAHSARSRRALDERFADWLAMADAVFPVSEATEVELRRAFPAASEKYRAVAHGATPRKAAPAERDGPPLFFTPASVTVNKNHLLLLMAARRLAEAGRDFRLVLTGRDTEAILADRPSGNAAAEAARLFYREHREVLEGRVGAPGFVPDEAVERLYASALRVVLVSGYEGFGLPLIEALERGVPVICSGIAPFREQVARYAMEDRVEFVDAPTEAGLVAALGRALDEPAPTALGEAEHRARIGRWTWDDAALTYAAQMEAL